MMLGYRKSAYGSIVFFFIFLSFTGALFVSGWLDSGTTPLLYVRSPFAWIIMIVVVCGVSITFAAPLELVPGAMQGSEERFRLAFENANIGMSLTSIDGHLLRVNAALCDILGYSREELEQMTVSQITHPDDNDTSSGPIRRQQSGKQEKVIFEKRYLHKKGHVVWTSIASSLYPRRATESSILHHSHS